MNPYRQAAKPGAPGFGFFGVLVLDFSGFWPSTHCKMRGISRRCHERGPGPFRRPPPDTAWRGWFPENLPLAGTEV